MVLIEKKTDYVQMWVPLISCPETNQIMRFANVWQWSGWITIELQWVFLALLLMVLWGEGPTFSSLLFPNCPGICNVDWKKQKCGFSCLTCKFLTFNEFFHGQKSKVDCSECCENSSVLPALSLLLRETGISTLTVIFNNSVCASP